MNNNIALVTFLIAIVLAILYYYYHTRTDKLTDVFSYPGATLEITYMTAPPTTTRVPTMTTTRVPTTTPIMTTARVPTTIPVPAPLTTTSAPFVSLKSPNQIKTLTNLVKNGMFNNLKLTEFSTSRIINISKQYGSYAPKVRGMQVFDSNGSLCLLSRIRDSLDMRIYFSYMTDNGWKTFDLTELVRVGNPFPSMYSGYALISTSERIVFNVENEAFFHYLGKIVKFDYKAQKVISVMNAIPEDVLCESGFTNGYPNLESAGSVSIYNGVKYIKYKIDVSRLVINGNVPWQSLVSTVEHSGKRPRSVIHKNKLYSVFSTMYGDRIDDYEYTGIKGKKGTPIWIAVFDFNTLTWSAPVLLGIVGTRNDSHNGPCICITSKGILYVFNGGHHEMVYYSRSKRPADINSFTSFTPMVTDTGASKRMFTYPGVVIDFKDKIYVMYRGPWYGLSLFTIDTKNNDKIVQRNILDHSRAGSIGGFAISNKNYMNWRHHINIDKYDNLYFSIMPKPEAKSLAAPPSNLTGELMFIIPKGSSKVFLME